MSVAHLPYSAPPQSFNRDCLASSRQPSKQQTVSLTSRRKSPTTAGMAQAIAERGPTTRPFSVGDSSDDDLPEPMKFSALTRALLEEGASVVDGSAPSADAHAEIVPTPPAEQYHSTIPRRQSPRSDNSSRGYNSGSPPSRRIVRLSAGSTGSATLRKGAPLTHTQSPAVETIASREVSPQDLITPAARPRNVYVKSSMVPAVPSSGAQTNTHYSDADNAPDEVNGASALATIGRHQSVEGHESVLRHGSTSLSRHKYGEESGLQSSIRIKRVGKVTGSFLSGPARRGRRRQSEEDNSPAQDNGSALPYENGADEVRRPSPDLAGVPMGSEACDFAQPETQEKRFKDGPHVTFATGSPGAMDDGDGQLRSNSPVAKSSIPRTSASEPNKSAALPVRPVFKVPPPPPSLPSRHDQENDPPPTFKRNKPSISALQSIIEPLAVHHEEKPTANARTVESPRRALANRSQNTPLRPAPPPPKMSVLETATATAGAAASSQSRKKRNHVSINGKVFQRVSCIGRGGSSRVYKVMAENDNFLAFKKVSFEDADEATVRGYKGEIDLLKKLYQVGRVINLIDWEINEEKRTLSMLMECGEIDFDKLLKSRLSSETVKFDISFARYYWKEMLECVQAVHDYGIVHTDLKPANFLLVKGHLKLIDFGIASAIQDDTVNIYREHLVGTSNFISPEAITDKNAKKGLAAVNGKVIKLGKPSDVWSLGCILYQMVYGKPPFAHIANQVHRIAVISNENHVVDFPRAAMGDVPVPPGLLKTLRGCITYDPDRRPTIGLLLSHTDPFLYPDADRDDMAYISQDVLARILTNVVNHCHREGIPAEHELATWPAAFFARIKKAQREEGLY